MASKIILKKSSVVNKVPLVSDLEYGELALNYADGKLYYKNAANTISALSGGGAGSTTNFTVSDTAPVNPNVGDEWLNSTSGKKFVYFADEDSSQWVEFKSDVVVSPVTNLSALTDVSDTPATNGQVLTWNSTEGLWKPEDSSSGGGGSTPIGQYTLSGTTSDNVETEIFIDGVLNSRIPINNNTAISYVVECIATSVDSPYEHAAINIRGAARNVSGVCSDLGLLYEIIVTTSNNSIVIDSRADAVNNALGIYVKGLPSRNFKFKVQVTVLEV